MPCEKIYAPGRNVATASSKKQVKTIIIPIDFACVESLKNGKYVLESPYKVLEFLVQKRVQTLFVLVEFKISWATLSVK